eukprot:TRINITY_DN10058_c0_g1_i1.p1 TRINITY_DN10058_c0_g1~~TRINITY_DN10058_c0_g1_i1.p1  ORF type:complete len:327 (+),score=59.21 TRINITY_DN10058_c0_g1_i1:30-1010(+)
MSTIPKEFTWSRVVTKSNAPKPLRYHSGTLYNNKLVVFGGTGGNKLPLNELWAFDLEQHTWEQIQSENPPPARYGAALLTIGDKLYVHGGTSDGYNGLSDFYSFDFTTKSWNQETSENGPTPRFFHSHCILDNKVYFFGGSKTNKIYYNDLFVYHPDKKVWEEVEIKNSPSPRAGSALFVCSKKLFLYGGYGGDGGFEYYSDVHSIDTEKEFEWVECQLTSETKPLTARPMNPLLVKDRVYLYGGSDGKRPNGQLYLFDPIGLKWNTIALWLVMSDSDIINAAVGTKSFEPIPRYGHVMVTYSNIIYVFGGSGSSYLNDVFMINLD